MEWQTEDQKFLKLLPSLGNYRSILCLNGILPEHEFFEHFDLPIIAADSAYDLLLKKNITADIIIGDCDSVQSAIAPNTKQIIIKDQNSSDFQKALQFSQENDLFPSIILGLNGGYIDHILNNITILAQTDSIAYMAPNVGIMLRGQKTLNLPLETKLSLFGMPSGKVSTHGLRWELDRHELNFALFNSGFNRTVREQVEFKVEGVIFLVIYLRDIVDAGKCWISDKN